MTGPSSGTRSIVIERELPFPPEKVWRALTQPHLVEEWLMKGSFRPIDGFQPVESHRFSLGTGWGPVYCQVQAVEPLRTISYSWNTRDLESVITWTLTRTANGTLLRMEQAGFRAEQQAYYRGASVRWPQLLDALEQVLSRSD